MRWFFIVLMCTALSACDEKESAATKEKIAPQEIERDVDSYFAGLFEQSTKSICFGNNTCVYSLYYNSFIDQQGALVEEFGKSRIKFRRKNKGGPIQGVPNAGFFLITFLTKILHDDFFDFRYDGDGIADIIPPDLDAMSSFEFMSPDFELQTICATKTSIHDCENKYGIEWGTVGFKIKLNEGSGSCSIFLFSGENDEDFVYRRYTQKEPEFHCE